LVASRNRKKLVEMRRVLDAAGLTGIDLVSLDDAEPFDEAPETGATFEENALAKARDAFAATGLASVADDSGLEVDALNGMPGVLSARWAGVHGDDAANNALLLAQLRDVPDERRGAAFVSASALASMVLRLPPPITRSIARRRAGLARSASRDRTMSPVGISAVLSTARMPRR